MGPVRAAAGGSGRADGRRRLRPRSGEKQQSRELWKALILFSYGFERASAYSNTARRHLPPPPHAQPGRSASHSVNAVLPLSGPHPLVRLCYVRAIKISWLPKRQLRCLLGVVPALCCAQGEE